MDVIVRKIGVKVVVSVLAVSVGVKLQTGTINLIPVCMLSDFILFIVTISFSDVANFVAMLVSVSFS